MKLRRSRKKSISRAEMTCRFMYWSRNLWRNPKRTQRRSWSRVARSSSPIRSSTKKEPPSSSPWTTETFVCPNGMKTTRKNPSCPILKTCSPSFTKLSRHARPIRLATGSSLQRCKDKNRLERPKLRKAQTASSWRTHLGAKTEIQILRHQPNFRQRVWRWKSHRSWVWWVRRLHRRRRGTTFSTLTRCHRLYRRPSMRSCGTHGCATITTNTITMRHCSP